MIKLYNTLTRQKEEFRALDDVVGVYACGPTVYSYAHIGNMRSYIFEDVLRRTLIFNNYKVKFVMNITDVGHLTSDEDTGEDKMAEAAKRDNMTAYEVADYYTKHFLEDAADCNILFPDILVKATETVKEQVDMIKIMEEKGYTYIIEDGVYFDTTKLDNYGELANLKDVKQIPGARIDVKDKKYPTDFALWKFSAPEEKRDMEWDSPWGVGFPGWHTECVAMALMHLGVPFDIHCGGIDHIPVHHTNEIAQGYAVFNKNISNYWLHNEFVIGKEAKMSKSKGETITVKKLKEESYNPLSYRYFLLNSHYRSPVEFSYEALNNAQNSYYKIKNIIQGLITKKDLDISKSSYLKEFKDAINNDISTCLALSVLWKMLRDKKLLSEEKYHLALKFDEVLGLDLGRCDDCIEDEEICLLASERDEARRQKNFEEADRIRKEIEKKGFAVEDTSDGYKIKKQ